MEKQFKCPKCNTTWNKTEHYHLIMKTNNLINIMIGNKLTIIDYCGKCNYFEYGS